MKKNKYNNIILIVGLLLGFFCSFVMKNIVLAIVVFIATFGLVIYRQRAALFASLAASDYKKGSIEKSFKLYEKAIALKGCPVMAKIIYAYRLINEGRISESVKLLDTLDYEHMSDNERLNYNATNALCIWKQGGLHRAIEIYEALLNEKDSMLIYETLGYLLLCAKDYEKALDFNLRAAKLYDTNERIKSNLATSYYYLGDDKIAAKIYKELIEGYVNFPEPYYYYGLLLETQKKYKGALKYWKIALEKKLSPLYILTYEEIQCKIDEISLLIKGEQE